MDAWRALCYRAFDDEKAATDLVLFLEGCGRVRDEDGVYEWTSGTHEASTLLTLGLRLKGGNVFELDGATWDAYVAAKRDTRRQWHEDKHRRLTEQLHALLASVQPLNDREAGLLALEQFSKAHATNLGTVPLMRALVGAIQFQRYKAHVIDWTMDDAMLTQNGDAMEDYVRLLKGTLGLTLVQAPPAADQTAIRMPDDDNSDFKSAVAMETPESSRLVWRWNSQWTDADLSAMLRLVRHWRPSPSGYYQLTSVARPSTALLPSNPVVRWALLFLRGCFAPLLKLFA
ncbi:hypothetical protein BC940DRAFT_288766 [Gongronella butleri]|nr:hypothetical protein BC940DRAFT_288766 [Gongronella butleri]